jgi:hypothetical protein
LLVLGLPLDTDIDQHSDETGYSRLLALILAKVVEAWASSRIFVLATSVLQELRPY